MAVALVIASASGGQPTGTTACATEARINDVRLGNITAYAQNYSNMTDNKADELVNGAIAYHRKRIDLLANTYDKVRAALGAPLAARFVQVESTLNNLIDLQIQSNLPLMWGPEKTGK